MIVVIDSNVLVRALSARNPLSVIIRAWSRGAFSWAISTDILLEYHEVVIDIGSARHWSTFEAVLDLASMRPGSLIEVSPAFHFLAIPSDRDDDKFADCAITAHADFIITSDRHFRPLNNAGYKPQPISPEAFIECFLPESP